MRQLIIMPAFLLFPITFNQTHTMGSIVTSHFLTDKCGNVHHLVDIIIESNSSIEKTILFSFFETS